MAQDQSICSDPVCELPVKARGLCIRHYDSWYGKHRHEIPHPSVEERFWAKVQKSENCWLWTAAVDGYGYGKFKPSGYRDFIRAHQFAWSLASGESVSPGKMILHTCDVPGCVYNEGKGTYQVGDATLPRFGHLALGTDLDNVMDMIAKGRHWGQKRARQTPFRPAIRQPNPQLKLSDKQVAEIHRLHKDEGLSGRSLASRFEVSHVHVNRILNGERRKRLLPT